MVVQKGKKKELQIPACAPADAERFSALCAEALLSPRSEGANGVGTLQEKRMHAVIKRFLCEDPSCHEVGIANTRYVADVRVGDAILEVQTGAFYPMQRKIAYYLEHTDCHVTVVHPIPALRWVSWLDPESGECSPRRRSPAKGGPLHVLPKLYSLAPYLRNPRFHLRLLFLEVQDLRLLCGWSRDRKRGSRLYERLPLALLGELSLTRPADYRELLPRELPECFPVKAFSEHTGLRGRDAYSAVRALCALGVLEQVPSGGRSMLFARKEESNASEGDI